MKILAISDEECSALWDYYVPGRLKEYDLIISCGDLKSDYLSFLVTMARCPVLFVHGNHDTHYAERYPQGCDCIDGQVVTYNGVRILDSTGSEQLIAADTVLIAAGMLATGEQYDSWIGLAEEVVFIGDCRQTGKILDAMRTGYCAGTTI